MDQLNLKKKKEKENFGFVVFVPALFLVESLLRDLKAKQTC